MVMKSRTAYSVVRVAVGRGSTPPLFGFFDSCSSARRISRFLLGVEPVSSADSLAPPRSLWGYPPGLGSLSTLPFRSVIRTYRSRLAPQVCRPSRAPTHIRFVWCRLAIHSLSWGSAASLPLSGSFRTSVSWTPSTSVWGYLTEPFCCSFVSRSLGSALGGFS